MDKDIDIDDIYSEFSSRLLCNVEWEGINSSNNHLAPYTFEYENIYIKNKKTYTRILNDLIYLEKVYREKYALLVFQDFWHGYDKYMIEWERLSKSYEPYSQEFCKELKLFIEKEKPKFFARIEALYYYYFVYQMYLNYRFYIDVDFALELEEERLVVAPGEDDSGYIDLLKKSFYKAYDSIILFNETNKNDFLNVEKMEIDIELSLNDCIEEKYNTKYYQLNYLQPPEFKSKDKSMRIRRKDEYGRLAIKTRSTYDASRKRNATRKKNRLVKKYYEQKEVNSKLSIRQFAKDNNISERTFYYYKNEYDSESR